MDFALSSNQEVANCSVRLQRNAHLMVIVVRRTNAAIAPVDPYVRHQFSQVGKDDVKMMILTIVYIDGDDYNVLMV